MRRIRPCPLAVACLGVVGALALGGCGTAGPAPAGPPVRLDLQAPRSGTRTSMASVLVSGTVSPARARVEVIGRAVPVTAHGSFSIRVGLGVGANLIDAEASLPHSVGAVSALSVIRFLLVTVPRLTGESPAQASDALRRLGLVPRVQSSSNPLAFLLPTAVQVCSSNPVAGQRVDPGVVVTLSTSKLCGL